MPKGVYKHKKLSERTPEVQEQIRRAMAAGRTKEAREKARASIILLSKNPDWRMRVSDGTKKAMHREDVRNRHLEALADARIKHGVNFKHGNGQSPGPFIINLAKKLTPLGFVPEFPIKTKGCPMPGIPTCYKADFAHPGRKIVVEVDGPSHYGTASAIKDAKKDAALRYLGWRVARVRH